MAPPARWELYSKIGKVIQNTNFIAFKVPLKKSISEGFSEDLRFAPVDLIQLAKKSGYDLGLVIDLTNTQRYYQPRDLLKENIKYKKIFIPGHTVPSKEKISEFFSTIDSFKKESSKQNRLIGVHCTHGLNRTGYMVCRYMIEKLGFKPEDAIKAFNDARGHKIERQNYIDNLHDLVPKPKERPRISAKGKLPPETSGRDARRHPHLHSVPKKKKNDMLSKRHCEKIRKAAAQKRKHSNISKFCLNYQ